MYLNWNTFIEMILMALPIVWVIVAFVVGFLINGLKNHIRLKVHLIKHFDTEVQMQIKDLEDKIKEKDKLIRNLKKQIDKKNAQLQEVKAGTMIINEALVMK